MAAVAITGCLATGLSACSGSDGAEDSDGSDTVSGTVTDQLDGLTEAAKGKACEEYRDLSAQVDDATAQAQEITVSTSEDGEKLSSLMSEVSDLTEKADAAYAICYAEGAETESGS